MAIFDEKIEIRERCKGVHCVDLGESFPTSIYLQKSASIQPRTRPSKFGGKFNSLFTSLLKARPPVPAAKPTNTAASGSGDAPKKGFGVPKIGGKSNAKPSKAKKRAKGKMR